MTAHKRTPSDGFWLKGLVIGLLLVAMVIVLVAVSTRLAPSCKADPASDDHFLAMLENVGLTWTDRDAIIHDGHYVCMGLWSGEKSTEDQANEVAAASPGLTAGDARAFVAIAIQAYCPNINAHYKGVDIGMQWGRH